MGRKFQSVAMSNKIYGCVRSRVDQVMSWEGGPKRIPDIEAAIGALFVGHMFGYRVLEAFHTWATRRKFSRLCGCRDWAEFVEGMPEYGPYWERHVVTRAMQNVGDWWRGLRDLPPDLAGVRMVVE